MLFFACRRLRVGISRLFFRSRIFCSLLNWLIFIGTELHTLFSVRSARVGSLFYCLLLKVYTRVSVFVCVWGSLFFSNGSPLPRSAAANWPEGQLNEHELFVCSNARSFFFVWFSNPKVELICSYWWLLLNFYWLAADIRQLFFPSVFQFRFPYFFDCRGHSKITSGFNRGGMIATNCCCV